MCLLKKCIQLLNFCSLWTLGRCLWQWRKQAACEWWKIVGIYGGLKTKDAVSAIVIEQAEEVKSIAMFSNPEENFYLRKLETLMIHPSSQVTYKVN